MGGVESSCHVNRFGRRVDMIEVTQHDTQASRDYALLREQGIRTVRDGLRWPLIDASGGHDFSSFVPMLTAAREQGIQVIWDLCHYGWPDDLDVFSPSFVNRFARFARAVAELVADSSDAVPFYTPVNEISFLTMAIGTGIMYPFVAGRDAELKRQLVRAATAAMDAACAVDRRARFVFAEPVIHVVPPADRPDQHEAAARARDSQFEVWDMLFDQGYLDIVGVNYYHANQWECGGERLRWEDSPRDPRMLPFRLLLTEVYRRYHRRLFVAETSHFGVGRGQWLREIAEEVESALEAGVPVEGICLYPVLDRPDWENYDHWHNSGLWDLRASGDGSLERILNLPYAEEFRRVATKLLPRFC
jgi:beta-glucosidase/6-phospho-beta-glucosidase/beta-galactosidase